MLDHERIVCSGSSKRDGNAAANGELIAVHLRVHWSADAEFQALQEAAVAMRHEATRKRVQLYVDRTPCLSCIGAMVQLQALGVSVEVCFESPLHKPRLTKPNPLSALEELTKV